jgi:hypothetical protein
MRGGGGLYGRGYQRVRGSQKGGGGSLFLRTVDEFNL